MGKKIEKPVEPTFYTWDELDRMPPLTRYGAFEAMANYQARLAEYMAQEMSTPTRAKA